MTVEILIETLKSFPPDMEVFMDMRTTEFKYGMIESVKPREINFSEDPDSKALAKDIVIVLSEEI